MILKLMNGENLSDDNTSKGCRIVDQVREVNFYHTNCPVVIDGESVSEEAAKNFVSESAIDVTYESPNRELLQETFILHGNAYLMNDGGKTIQSFAKDSYK